MQNDSEKPISSLSRKDSNFSGRRESASLFVGFKGLSFEDENSVRVQLLEDSFEHEFHSFIAVVKVNPLCNTQAQNHIILRFLKVQEVFILKDVIRL
jgi:hypothetical protein